MRRTQVCIIAAVLFALSACSSVERFMTESPTTAEMTFKYATAKIIDSEPARADKILSAVADAREYVGTDASVTVSFLYGQAVERINWDRLNPADTILMRAILQSASDRLQREIGAGVLDETQEVRLLTVLDWIEGVALLRTETIR